MDYLNFSNCYIFLIEPQKCIEIGINDSLNQTKVKQIKVYGKANANNDDYEFNETKKFTYKRVNYFTLIETDKPVYKPGDKGTKNSKTKQIILAYNRII